MEFNYDDDVKNYQARYFKNFTFSETAIGVTRNWRV